ncbi:MAG: putative metalloprotease CJM1_0395 family protein, partial [Alphaproteobacteria bacterium]|nr:putative metalloprotease CJM1_0395 family protein [Alphaproteobacteria bacterium]
AGNQGAQLSEGERKQVQELKKQDAAIHRHEQAHAAAGGQFAGAPQYGFTTGPDGQRYANSGHVSIDVTPVAGDPKATIEKMTIVQRAANAPAEPSGADRSVAARAAATKQTAQLELAKLKAEERAEPEAEEGFVPGFTKDSEPPKGKPAASAAGVSHAAAAAAYAASLNAVSGA